MRESILRSDRVGPPRAQEPRAPSPLPRRGRRPLEFPVQRAASAGMVAGPLHRRNSRNCLAAA
ncbi:hypothetical protein ACM43_18965 [Bradyrhizobium sp. CCBAU 45321]|nr:hypothetical protein [Bradyrhizobium sp. CCBAU 45321]